LAESFCLSPRASPRSRRPCCLAAHADPNVDEIIALRAILTQRLHEGPDVGSTDAVND
jgi:hypothetical protein